MYTVMLVDMAFINISEICTIYVCTKMCDKNRLFYLRSLILPDIEIANVRRAQKKYIHTCTWILLSLYVHVYSMDTIYIRNFEYCPIEWSKETALEISLKNAGFMFMHNLHKIQRITIKICMKILCSTLTIKHHLNCNILLYNFASVQTHTHAHTYTLPFEEISGRESSLSANIKTTTYKTNKHTHTHKSLCVNYYIYV